MNKKKQASRQYQTYHGPLPSNQTELFRQCVAKGILAPLPARQFRAPFPHWYDENAYCEFHSGGQGHTTNNCYILRDQLYRLIEAGRLKPTQATTPNTNVGNANMIEE